MIGDGEANENVIGSALGVFSHDIEITILLKDSGIEDVELALVATAASVLLDQSRIGEFALRILVERLHVRMRRG